MAAVLTLKDIIITWFVSQNRLWNVLWSGGRDNCGGWCAFYGIFSWSWMKLWNFLLSLLLRERQPVGWRGSHMGIVCIVPCQAKLFLHCILVLLRGFAVDLYTPSKTDYGSLYLSSSWFCRSWIPGHCCRKRFYPNQPSHPPTWSSLFSYLWRHSSGNRGKILFFLRKTPSFHFPVHPHMVKRLLRTGCID